MTDMTVNDVYAGLNQFKDFVQANLPYKLTCYKGLIDPSADGHPGNIPSLYMQVDTLDDSVSVLLNTYIKVGPANIDWQIFGSGAPTVATTWYIGTGLANPAIGADGDWYFDQSASTRGVYTKSSGAWVQKTLGTNWYSGTGVPNGNTLGLVNDFYLRTDTPEIYLKTGATTWTLVFAGGGGGAVVWNVVSTNFTIVAGQGYIVDTAAGPITATLPVTLSNTFYVPIKDANGTFATNNLTIQKGIAATYTIANDTNPLIVDVNYANLSLAYDGTNDNVAI